jgi:YfiH family protein
MIRKEYNGLCYYQFESFSSDWISHGIFTRLGGVSRKPFNSLNLSISVPDNEKAVMENRRRFYQVFNVDRTQAARVVQVHGARVDRVDTTNRMKTLPGTDGIVTDTIDVPLVMAFADCVPVMLFDPVVRAVGMVHAGWRGTVAGVCQAAIKCMVESFGSRPGDIQAAIGPSIGPCCYEVGPDLVDAVSDSDALNGTEGLFQPGKTHRLHFDQWAANERALRQAGVEKIERSDLCTACHVDEFYSHRAENGKTGRFGALIMINNTLLEKSR